MTKHAVPTKPTRGKRGRKYDAAKMRARRKQNELAARARSNVKAQQNQRFRGEVAARAKKLLGSLPAMDDLAYEAAWLVIDLYPVATAIAGEGIANAAIRQVARSIADADEDLEVTLARKTGYEQARLVLRDAREELRRSTLPKAASAS